MARKNELEHFCRIVDELDDDNAWDSFHDLQVSLLSIQNSNLSGRRRSPGHKYSRHLYFRPFFTLFGGSTDNCIKYIYELEYLMFFTWSSGFVFEHIWGQAMNSSSISGRFRPVFGEICFCCFGVVFVCFGLALGVFGTVHLPPLRWMLIPLSDIEVKPHSHENSQPAFSFGRAGQFSPLWMFSPRSERVLYPHSHIISAPEASFGRAAQCRLRW